MSIDFPNAPGDQELFAAPNGITYIYSAATNQWAAVAGPPGATQLSDLTDAQVINPLAGDMLVYDAVSTEFANQTIYVPVWGLFVQPDPKVYVVGYKFAHPHVIEDLSLVAGGGSGTVKGMIRTSGGDNDIGGLESVAFTAVDGVTAATSANEIQAGESLLLQFLSVVAAADLSYNFRCRRIYS